MQPSHIGCPEFRRNLSRRHFVKAGSLGMTGLGLADILRLQAASAKPTYFKTSPSSFSGREVNPANMKHGIPSPMRRRNTAMHSGPPPPTSRAFKSATSFPRVRNPANARSDHRMYLRQCISTLVLTRSSNTLTSTDDPVQCFLLVSP
jgi:hypothetical protein